jgi:hypothetical protein
MPSASWRPEKYAEFHVALLGQRWPCLDEASAIEVAQSLGVSEKQIRAEMAKSPNDDASVRTYQLAQNLGITGTPSYVIGNELVQGAVGLDDLEPRSRTCAPAARPAAETPPIKSPKSRRFSHVDKRGAIPAAHPKGFH